MTLLNMMPRGFPSKVGRLRAQEAMSRDSIQWLVDHNILSTQYPDEYGLVDEFLRIRFMLDEAETTIDEEGVAAHLLAYQENAWGLIEEDEEDSDRY